MIILPDILREVTAVAAVLGILGTTLYALRRYQAPRDGASGPLRTISRLRLSENLVLHLIECSGERYLVTEPKSGQAELRGFPARAPALSQERWPLGLRRRRSSTNWSERRSPGWAGSSLVGTTIGAADA